MSDSVVSEARVEMIPVHQIKPSEFALRSVDKTNEEYLQLVESIRQQGVLNAVLVTDVGQGVFGLVDGLHRVTAAKDAGVTTIPAVIRSMDDTRMMEAQIIANIHKVETKPMEYTKQLFKLLAADPLLTKGDLAEKLSVTTSWLDTRLSLNNLTPAIQELVNDGRIGLANAYSLAKLPAEEQGDFVDRAITDAPTMFVPTVAVRVKAIKEANRKGKEAAPAEFTAIPRLQPRPAVEAEKDNFKVGSKLIEQLGATTVQEGWQAAIQWVLQLDPDSVAAQRKRYEDRKALSEQAKANAKAQREQKKAEDAAKAQADISNL